MALWMMGPVDSREGLGEDSEVKVGLGGRASVCRRASEGESSCSSGECVL